MLHNNHYTRCSVDEPVAMLIWNNKGFFVIATYRHVLRYIITTARTRAGACNRPYSRCQSSKPSLVFLNRASYGRRRNNDVTSQEREVTMMLRHNLRTDAQICGKSASQASLFVRGVNRVYDIKWNDIIGCRGYKSYIHLLCCHDIHFNLNSNNIK